MDTLSPTVAAIVVVVATVGAVPAAGLAGDALGSGTAQADGADEGLAPGEQLSAVVNVQQAEIDGEVSARAFDQRLARAGTNDSQADVVADEVDRIEQRLDELAAEKRELETAYENGSLARGEYRARLARLHAEQRSLERRANRTEATARGLPAEALEANGVNVSAIRQLRANAANLTGPEVAEIARGIAGKGAGDGLGPSQRGPPDFVENRTGGPPEGAGPGEDAANGDETGQGPPNETGGGPPEDAGNGGPNDDGSGGQPNGTNATAGAGDGSSDTAALLA